MITLHEFIWWFLEKKCRLLIVILCLVAADRIMYRVTNIVILRNHAFIHENKYKDKLIWSGTSKQGCQTNRIFLLYKYKTCFNVFADKENKEEWVGAYYYTRPLAVFSILKLTPLANYYYEELSQGKIILYLRYDGSIKKVI